MNKIMIGTVGLLLFTAGPVYPGSLNEVSDSQPEVETYEGIPYVNGGFGVEERAALRAASKADNLELSFALQNGDYLGGAEILIKDRNGKEIFEAVSDGPLLFVKLPEGVYIVEATVMGKTLEQTVHVPSKGQARVYFAWKDSIASHTLAKK